MQLIDLIGSRFVDGDESLPTYVGPIAGVRTDVDLGEAAAAIWRLESELGRAGSERRRVGVLSNHQVETYVSVLACVTGHHTFVPLNPKFPTSRLEQIVELADVDVVLADAGTVAVADAMSLTVPVINVSDVMAAPVDPDDASALSAWRQDLTRRTLDPDEIAYIMFTSGSTGTPKGVPISYGNLRSYVDGITSTVGIERGQRFTQFFDLSFDLSIHDIFVSNALWGTLVAPTPIDLMMPSGYVARERINIWFSVPILGAQLSRAKRNEGFAGIDHMLFCGEALPMETVISCRNWLSADGDIWNLYGPTEATIAFTAARVTESARPAGNASIGLPFGRNEVALLVDGVVHRTLDDGLEGELLLGGAQVFGGYSPEAPSPFLDTDGTRWYHSGDLVRIDHEGVYFRGRVDSQIKYRGYRVELGEIEAAIRKEFGIHTLAVVLVGEQSSAEIVAFYLASEFDAEIDPSRLSGTLPSYMVPGSFVAVEQMPTNSNNKIDRKRLATWPRADESAT